MTEKEFWKFFKASLDREGRVPQMSGYVDDSDPVIQKAGKYFGGHSLLFNGHDRLPVKMIADMGRLLFQRGASLGVKEVILMILAHHPSQEALRALQEYNKTPDAPLRYTAHFALEECQFWNE